MNQPDRIRISMSEEIVEVAGHMVPRCRRMKCAWCEKWMTVDLLVATQECLHCKGVRRVRSRIRALGPILSVTAGPRGCHRHLVQDRADACVHVSAHSVASTRPTTAPTGSCSHTRTTVQPAASSLATVSASRRRVASSFGSQ